MTEETPVSIQMISELEDAQETNDRIIELATKQNAIIEAVIQKLIGSGTFAS